MSRTGIAVVVLLTLLFSCEESFVSDCRECYPESVPPAYLKILYSYPDYIPGTHMVTLYEGAVEDGIIIREYIIEIPVSSLIVDAILYKDYSATLEIFINGRKYITTAAACPKAGYDEDSCEEPCYFVYDNVLDLRLSYH